MSNRRQTNEGFFKKLLKSKNFRQYGIAGIVIIVGVILIITAPWQSNLPPVDSDETPPVSSPTPEPTPDSTEPPPTEQPTEPTTEPTPTPDPIPGIYNPLTGQPWHQELGDNRPWAVAIGNTRPAMPVQGIGKADIIWEVVVEGATRLIAIYHDAAEMDAVGGIRSVRRSSYEIARSYDALYVHSGGWDPFDHTKAVSGVPSHIGTLAVDGHPQMSYRDTYRRSAMGLEHSLMTTGKRLLDHIGNVDIRTEHSPSYDVSMSFVDDGTPASGDTADNVEVRFFSNSKTTTFIYSASDKVYHVRQHGNDMIDGNGSIKAAFTNVLVLQTSLQFGANPHGHTFVTTIGEGSGYFINGGKYVEITWSRADLDSPFIYKLTDGTELEFGVGKTYVCMISRQQTPIFS